MLAVPFVLMSFQAQRDWPLQIPIPVSVKEMPSPHDMVVIRQENGPYTVPGGKLFVLTGLGNTSYVDNSYTDLHVDGVLEIGMEHDVRSSPSPASCTIAPIPAGFTVHSGSVITLDGRTDRVHRAWGYLVDA